MKISRKIFTIISNLLILVLMLCTVVSCGKKEESDISITLNSTSSPKATTTTSVTSENATEKNTTIAQVTTMPSTTITETTIVPSTTITQTSTVPPTTITETTAIPPTTIAQTSTVSPTTIVETTTVTPVETAAPTTIASPAAVFSLGTNYDSYIAYDCNTKVYNDLNMDGINEEIEFICPTGDDNYYIPYDYGTSDIYVKVNNVTYSLNDFSIDGIVDQIYITDINVNDNIKELAFCTYGPSVDYATIFLYFANDSFIEMGYIPGILSNPSSNGSSLYLNGQGNITSSFYRLNLFQTWFSTQDYTLSDGHIIIETPKAMYICDEHAPLKLLQPIVAYMQPSRESQRVTLTPTNGYVHQTDNKNWVQFIAEDGTSVWLYVEDFGTLPDSNNIVSNVFEGLTLYD